MVVILTRQRTIAARSTIETATSTAARPKSKV
jgi:hypothetical protein